MVCPFKRPLLRRDLRRDSNPELAAHVGKAHVQLMDAIRHADEAPLLTRLTLARLEKQLLRLSLKYGSTTTIR